MEVGGKWDDEKTKAAVKNVGGGEVAAPPKPGGSPCEDLTQRCPACDRQGLMILPLRYAVANADVSPVNQAPSLKAPFGNVVGKISLPTALAKYTLRLMREGYIYVFNEKLGEAGWKGYTSDARGYLAEFDLHDENPPVAKAGNNAPCGRRAGSEMARCIAIPDAHVPGRVGKVWLAFTDTPWTTEVLKKHRASAELRELNMRCIDVAAWATSGTDQPHVGSLSTNLMNVAEFKLGTHLLDKVMQPLNQLWPLGFQGAISTFEPAFAGTSIPFHSAQGELPKIMDGARTASRGIPLALVALEDPVGIAMDLNSQILHRARAWHDEPLRKWKRESAQAVTGLQRAVQNGAVQRTSEARSTSVGLLATWFPATVGSAVPGRGVGEKMEHAGYVGEDEAERLGKKAWDEDHLTFYDAKRMTDYINRELPAERAEFERSTIDPLDEAYVSWMRSSCYRNHFSCNFDRANMDSGIAYTQKLYLILADAIGRQRVAAYLSEKLRGDFDGVGGVELRALMLNQDALIDAWMKSVKAKSYEQESMPWDALAGQFYGMFKDVVTSDGYKHYLGLAGAARASGLLGIISKYAFMVSGPILKSLGRITVGASTWVASSLPQRRIMALLGAVAKAENPNIRLVDLRTASTRKEASRMVAGLLETIAGGHEQQYRSAVRESLDRVADARGRRYPYNAILLVDEDAARRISQFSGSARDSHITSSVLSHEEFDRILNRSVFRLKNIDASASFVGAVLVGLTLSSLWKEFQKADENEKNSKFFNLAGGLASTLGGLAEAAGHALSATSWGASRHSVMLLTATRQYSTRAGLLVGGGKLLGSIGGFIGGALAVSDGVDDFSLSPGYGAAMIALGGLGIVAAVLGFFFSFSLFGLAVGILIAILLIVVAKWKPTKAQRWLDSSYFGYHKKSRFSSQGEEVAAFKALGEED
ncbi:T6SS effector BTH_I2691 family protein [Stenotrophomonas maltophilia]|uniref:T6SS effector BTH_I2691 family protein n=1 Tax=Stenotrophomonas maltophilia TaxID=40324 RepID=UPI002895055E|nr:T6SS effector BTH_I2691 family protein [Stenotrophomonas maltophilia]MDT3499598.1 T6SS effector BTH_I2691 family protein [Stenotrophomonas maltophilia]